MTLIIFLLVLSILILIHELGHFVAAKKSGVDVEEFGFGYPPRILGKKIGGTIYSINLLPFGGFVRLKGEEEGEMPKGGWKDPKNFQAKSPLIRLIIISAGVFMNLILAFALYYVFLFSNNFESRPLLLLKDYKFKYGITEKMNTVVTAVEKGSSAEKAGFEFGDNIYLIESEVEKVNIGSVSELQGYLRDKSEQRLKFYVKNVNTKESRVLEVIPKYNKDLDRSVIGVLLSKVVILKYETAKDKLLSGPLHSYNMTSYSLTMLSDLIKKSVEEKDMGYVSDTVSGPVGIYSLVSDILTIEKDKALLELMNLTALLSLSLSMLNILPFPALDGGRGVFIIFELLTRKRVNPRVEVFLHRAGMAILLALIISITFKDIRAIIR